MAKSKKRRIGSLGAITSCISVTLVLILLGCVVTFITMAMNFSRSVRENFTVEVLLDDSISARELAALKTRLTAKPYTKHINYISKEQGTREMMTDLGAPPEDFVGGSPIPAELEVYLKAEYANKDSLARYMPAVQSEARVKEVVYPLDLMDTMNYSIRIISMVLLALATLLALVSFSLINNTVRMSIYARRYTIHTMKLVGARWSFIRRPFLVRAMVIGLVSALLADGLLYAGMEALKQMNVNAEFEVVTPEVVLITLGTVTVSGLLLTLVCAFFSVNRHLRMNADEVFLK